MREQGGAGWCGVGQGGAEVGEIYIYPLAMDLTADLRGCVCKWPKTCEQHNTTGQGKRRKMFWVEKNRGEWGNECVSCVSNASTIFPAAAATSWLHHPPGSPPPQPPLPLVQVPSCDPKL